MMDIKKMKLWELNIRKQVKVCPHNCLAEIVDRICYAKTPINNPVLQAMIDYIKLPPELANSVYQIVLDVSMLDYNNTSSELGKNHRFRYFGCGSKLLLTMVS